MLVLTRKSNQSIMIGDDIEVSVLSIMGEKVRIGIQAPRDIPVFRKEVYLEIQQENVAAGASARAEVDDALKRPGLGAPAQPLAPLAVLLDLLEERVLDLGDALTHAHGPGNLTRAWITPRRAVAAATIHACVTPWTACPASRRLRDCSPRPPTRSRC